MQEDLPVVDSCFGAGVEDVGSLRSCWSIGAHFFAIFNGGGMGKEGRDGVVVGCC